MKKFSDTFIAEPGIIAVIGSGGKTSLIRVLAKELSKAGRVLICTTTKIYPPEDIRLLTEEVSAKKLEEAFKSNNPVCIGTKICVKSGGAEEIKLTAAGIPFCDLIECADYVLVEADGSRGLPLKAHNENEPVIPEQSSCIIWVVGAQGIGKKVSEAAHRPELYARIAGLDENDVISPQAAAAVINSELPAIRKQCRADIKVFINQADTGELCELSKRAAVLINARTYIGSVKGGKVTDGNEGIN